MSNFILFVILFSFCCACSGVISVSLEFSTNHGRSWSLLHTECLPEICAGPHLPHSTIYSSENYSGWVILRYQEVWIHVADSKSVRKPETSIFGVIGKEAALSLLPDLGVIMFKKKNTKTNFGKSVVRSQF